MQNNVSYNALIFVSKNVQTNWEHLPTSLPLVLLNPKDKTDPTISSSTALTPTKSWLNTLSPSFQINCLESLLVTLLHTPSSNPFNQAVAKALVLSVTWVIWSTIWMATQCLATFPSSTVMNMMMKRKKRPLVIKIKMPLPSKILKQSLILKVRPTIK